MIDRIESRLTSFDVVTFNVGRMHTELNLDSIVSRRACLVATAIDQDKVFLDIASGKYFGVNRVGVAIWDLLESPTSIRDICRELEGRFDVATEVCRDETVGFCRSLAESGSLVVEAA